MSAERSRSVDNCPRNIADFNLQLLSQKRKSYADINSTSILLLPTNDLLTKKDYIGSICALICQGIFSRNYSLHFG
ncbi:MAG: hypothetical protein MHMPM18_000958 [Marteilia pararefringens]